jgi:hypothetical protein
MSFTMWGGQYNPIIPVDDSEIAEALVKLFRVDDFVRMSQSSDVGNFIQAHSNLPSTTGGALFAPAPPHRKNTAYRRYSSPPNSASRAVV